MEHTHIERERERMNKLLAEIANRMLPTALQMYQSDLAKRAKLREQCRKGFMSEYELNSMYPKEIPVGYQSYMECCDKIFAQARKEAGYAPNLTEEGAISAIDDILLPAFRMKRLPNKYHVSGLYKDILKPSLCLLKATECDKLFEIVPAESEAYGRSFPDDEEPFQVTFSWGEDSVAVPFHLKRVYSELAGGSNGAAYLSYDGSAKIPGYERAECSIRRDRSDGRWNNWGDAYQKIYPIWDDPIWNSVPRVEVNGFKYVDMDAETATAL
jgi:hypothetical protein